MLSSSRFEVPLLEYEPEELERIQQIELGIENNEIQTKPMFFMKGNYFHKTNILHFSPVEIAIGKFNLIGGCEEKYHSFINLKQEEIGEAWQANKQSERIQHLMPPPRAMGERNFQNIYRNILNVLGIRTCDIYPTFHNERKRVFALEEDIEMMESILSTISGDVDWKQYFDLFALETFYHELKNVIAFNPEKPNHRLPIAGTSCQIRQCFFDLSTGISCSFHEQKEVSNQCALSIIHRWYYNVVYHVGKKVGVEMVQGVNLPSTFNPRARKRRLR